MMMGLQLPKVSCGGGDVKPIRIDVLLNNDQVISALRSEVLSLSL